MLLALYEEVSEVQDRPALLSCLVRFAAHLDFGRTAILFASPSPSGYAITTIANNPAGYEEAFRSAPDHKRDPVMQSLRVTNKPLLWSQQTYTDAGAGDLWDIQAPFGYKAGVAVSLHLPHGSYVMLGIDRDAALPKRDASKARLLADVQLMAVHAQDAATRLLRQADRLLTPKEEEILKWVAAGKSNNVIAQIVGITANTVDFHLRNINKKLGCSNRHSAVIKAAKLGLITSTDP